MTPREVVLRIVEARDQFYAEEATELVEDIFAALKAEGLFIGPLEATPDMLEAALRTFVRENHGIEHAPTVTWRAMRDEWQRGDGA